MLLERTIRGLEEDNTRLANMYEQVAKSKDVVFESKLSESQQRFEQEKAADKKA